MSVKLTIEDINPFIRYAQFLTITSNRQYDSIASYDYRMFYCRSGAGQITIEDTVYEMNVGSIIFWPPGYKYSLHLNKSTEQFDLIGVNFDFTRNFINYATPVPPSKWRNFNSKSIIELVTFTDYPELNSPICINNVQFLENTMNNIVSEFISKKSFYISIASGLLKSNFSLIARLAVHQQISGINAFPIDKVVQYIHSHYRDNITNQNLGKIFGYHPNHLNRLMVQHNGMSIHQYIIKCRINTAIELIQASDLKTAEISEAIGFNDVTHFLKCFKKTTGKTTKDFKKKI